MEGWIRHGVPAPILAPRHARRKAHKLQRVLRLWAPPAHAADHQPYIHEGTCSVKCKHILAGLLYCVVIPLPSSISPLTLEHSASWLHTYLWSCRPSRATKSKFRKCVGFFCFYFRCPLFVSFWLLWSWWWRTDSFSSALFYFILFFLHCVWHIWNWIYCLITDAVFVFLLFFFFQPRVGTESRDLTCSYTGTHTPCEI